MAVPAPPWPTNPGQVPDSRSSDELCAAACVGIPMRSRRKSGSGDPCSRSSEPRRAAPWSAVVFRCGHLSLVDDGDRVRCDRPRILAGETKENPMNDKRARELVARERARIEQSLRELNADVMAEVELHQQQTGEASEAGTDLDREEIDIALVADLREGLEAVGRAEARIAAGKYGRSIDTGAQIPDERLEAAPLAERTIEEQRRLENGVG